MLTDPIETPYFTEWGNPPAAEDCVEAVEYRAATGASKHVSHVLAAKYASENLNFDSAIKFNLVYGKPEHGEVIFHYSREGWFVK